MLDAMESHAAAAGPWIVLGVAAVALLALAGVALRGGTVARRAQEDPGPAVAPTGATSTVGEFRDDDLGDFLDHPPGTPRARPAVLAASPPRAGTALLGRATSRHVPLASTAPGAPGTAARSRPGWDVDALPATDGSGRLVAAMAATALLAIAAAAGVALATGAASAPRPASPGSPSATTALPDPPPPVLSPVPVAPRPGEPGAGELAFRSVPLGSDGVAASLTFDGIVLEQRAVGVTVSYPSVSLTATGEAAGNAAGDATGDAAGDGAALAHVRLPVYNCLSAAAPPDPVAAGCRPSPPEFADLPAPALAVSRSGDALRFTGRFPTYTRPQGTSPVYTGRVYELSVTVTPEGRLPGDRARASAELHLGTDRAETVDAPGVNVIQYGR